MVRKLIIQIPCFNEEKTIGEVIESLPRSIPNVGVTEVLIIDDGSTDTTVEAARAGGADHVFSLGHNRGYGVAFLAGIRRCMELGADIIVNTDGDNQYQGDCVVDLIQPIVEGNADIVVGTRPIDEIQDFSWIKKKLQRFGSYVTRRLSGTDVPDTTSGFRAYTMDAAMRLHLLSEYSHSLETIIQAGQMNMSVRHVPIRVNAKSRESRLMTSTWQYIAISTTIILRSYIRYRPFHTFLYLSVIPGLAGLAICVRFLYYYFTLEMAGRTQSLILAAILIIISFSLIALGILADLVGANRKLNQEILYLARSQVYVQNNNSKTGPEKS